MELFFLPFHSTTAFGSPERRHAGPNQIHVMKTIDDTLSSNAATHRPTPLPQARFSGGPHARRFLIDMDR
jgi:hypothetical protein